MIILDDTTYRCPQCGSLWFKKEKRCQLSRDHKKLLTIDEVPIKNERAGWVCVNCETELNLHE